MIKKQILIVDGDITHSERLKRKLEEEQYNVDAVYHGYEAFMVLKSKWVDLIICSIRLQGVMNGIQLLQELKKHHDYQKIPVIVQSSKVNLEEAVKNLGADLFISKPYDINDLIKQIKLFFK